MREDWRTFEQSLALGLLQSGGFSAETLTAERAEVPDWAFVAAAELNGVEVPELREWLGNQDSPNQCSAQIAILQAMLERCEEVTPAMLASIGGI